MVQYARPDLDDTDGNWTDQDDGSSLYEAIDEASADDATTYIKIADEWYGDEACIVRLSDVSAPATAGTYIKYKAKASDGMMMGPPGLKLELLQGDSVLSPAVEIENSSVSTDWTDYSYTVTDVSGISDWTDLKLRITMVSNSGMGDYMYVTQAYLETQDAGGPIWHVSASGSGSSGRRRGFRRAGQSWSR